MKFTVLLVVFCTALTASCEDSQVSPLIDDIRDFLKLMPLDKFSIIFEKHLESNSEFGNVVRYLQGDVWANLVNDVRIKPEMQDFKNYMKDAGINIHTLVADIHAFIAHLNPGAKPRKKENLRSFLDEIEEEMQLDKLIVLLDDKMENSKGFKDFYNKISSQKAKKLFEEVCALPEVQRVSKRLAELGINIKEYLELTYESFGWDE